MIFIKKFLFLVLALTGCGLNGLDESTNMIATASSGVDGREAYFAVDGNSDTFWCTQDFENQISYLTVIFPEERRFNSVTFLGGSNAFARPDIVEVWYDAQAEALGELHFTDSNKDQTFDMPKDSATSVTFKIMTIFSGEAKDRELCVAEIEFD